MLSASAPFPSGWKEQQVDAPLQWVPLSGRNRLNHQRTGGSCCGEPFIWGVLGADVACCHDLSSGSAEAQVRGVKSTVACFLHVSCFENSCEHGRRSYRFRLFPTKRHKLDDTTFGFPRQTPELALPGAGDCECPMQVLHYDTMIHYELWSFHSFVEHTAVIIDASFSSCLTRNGGAACSDKSVHRVISPTSDGQQVHLAVSRCCSYMATTFSWKVHMCLESFNRVPPLGSLHWTKKVEAMLAKLDHSLHWGKPRIACDNPATSMPGLCQPECCSGWCCCCLLGMPLLCCHCLFAFISHGLRLAANSLGFS